MNYRYGPEGTALHSFSGEMHWVGGTRHLSKLPQIHRIEGDPLFKPKLKLKGKGGHWQRN